jgi:hypothetical protein
LTKVARILERMIDVRERGLMIAKEPKSNRPIAQDCNPHVVAESRRQRTVVGN